MKKADKILLTVITLSAVLILVCGIVYRACGKRVHAVDVWVSDKECYRYPLDKDGEYEIVTADGHNTLKIENGEARIVDADCPGGDCMKMKIDSNGGSIICLPHKLSIVPDRSSPEDTDAVTR